MGWLFIFAVVFLMVFLVLDSTRTRMVAAGVFAVIAAVIAFFVWRLEVVEQREVPPAADDRLQDTRALERKTALARDAIKVQEVAVADQQFGPHEQEYRDASGTLKKRVDLFSWRFSGNLGNQNSDYTLRDAVFRIRLFSCPDFITGDQELDTLAVKCNTIGDRRVALYELNLPPGQSKAFDETVTFDNQPQPGNWRYWAETISATARLD